MASFNAREFALRHNLKGRTTLKLANGTTMSMEGLAAKPSEEAYITLAGRSTKATPVKVSLPKDELSNDSTGKGGFPVSGMLAAELVTEAFNTETEQDSEENAA
jgi:hypothetical protein